MKLVWAGEMALRYLTLLLHRAPWMLGAALLGGGLVWLWRRPVRPPWLERLAAARWPAPALTAAALCVGLILAVQGASVFDDAFISLRYAHNLLDGHGLVFNPGERVEGYTNFLWTVLMAGLARLSGRELPLVALLACLLSYVGCGLALWRLERAVLGAALPAAALLFLLQRWTIDYATSGMETGFAVLWVLLGLLALVRARGAGGAALAGAAFITATFTRLDHGLFWAAGGLALAIELRARDTRGWRAWLPARTAWSTLGAYAASFLPFALYMAWKLHYYGQLLPNTFYAKSGGSLYLSQGLVYLWSFLLGAHAWVSIPLAVVGLLAPAHTRPQRLLRSFAAVALVVWNLYVVKVGGDFMVGRFYLVTLPLWLLLAHAGVRRLLAEASTRRAVLAAALLAATVGGVEIVAAGPGRWNLSHEASHYRVRRWSPRVEIGHANWRTGTTMHALFTERGIHPVIATSGIGMVGYYSELECIDKLGLTDATVAREPVRQRRMAGHEKRAPQSYLNRREVQLIRSRSYWPKAWSDATRVDFGVNEHEHWHFQRWDPALIAQIEAQVPELVFPRIEPRIDRWVRASVTQPLEEVQRDVRFLNAYYFCCNDDPVRRAKVDEALEHARRRAAMGLDAGGSPSPARETP